MTDVKLEKYLHRLDKALGSISVSEKAEIITEIKSHILEALSRDPSQSIESVLNSLGEPEQVASRYLLEKGLKPNKPPFHPIFKWLIIGFLGTLLIFGIFSSVLLWKLSPKFVMNNNIGYFELLNGSLKVKFNLNNDDDTSIYFSKPDQNLSKSIIVDKNKFSEINLNFAQGDIFVTYTDKNELFWNCENTHSDDKIDINESEKEKIQINMRNISFAKCKIQVPIVNKLVINGLNGSIHIENPVYITESTLENGKIFIKPDTKLKYNFNNKIVNGSIDKFSSTNSSNAIDLKTSVTNGNIIKN
ncbi:hypothetical protein GCL60_02420 [Silvanigrella paludirubra]|uniref:Uncharacterized protein n=1 Tax=Silvanigrella paludirubra TaxID=2499159 RepID=A0A6N6VZT0_9BACT|nr:hypothetical protein [Silvanigrella paludirubra]KAB8040802.1 hypothetical protein GCL60_02420 [Silvanigrella paludirubra]